MEVDKRGVKGGFFQLFDWNGKSRKKLFSGKPEFAESSSQGKENYHGSVVAQHQPGLEKGFPSNARGQNDYNYASSANGDSEHETKAPGVVARLMGLDSLPKSKVNEASTSPFVEPQSFRDSSYFMPGPSVQGEHDIVIFESGRNKLDGFSRNPLDLRAQKMQSQHLERFQTEVLPPRSAKPISVTHNRLLSPIKSPGFIPSKNAAYIIEAAAKLIEQSPRSTAKGKFPSLGSSSSSSSIPFRVQNIKEKMDVSQKTSQTTHKSEDQTPLSLKKHINARSNGGSGDSYFHKASEESKRVGFERSNSKEKPVPFEVRAKANIIQKRNGPTSLGNKSSFEKQKEHNDVRISRVSRDIPNTRKKLENKSNMRSHSEVLKLNNQKQNRAFVEEEEKVGSCSYRKERKESNLSTIHGRTNRNVNKTVVNNVVTSRKTNFVVAESGKELSSLRANTISKKKITINGNTHSGDSATENTGMLRDENFVKCNIEFEGVSKWDEFDKRRNSLDVVSFTFTSPIKKSGAESSSCGRILEDESEIRNSTAHSLEFNVVGRDALTVLLDKKLKELTSRVEMSHKDLPEVGSLSNSSNSYGNMNSTIDLLKSLPVNSDTLKLTCESQYNPDCASILEQGLQAEKEKKGLSYMECDDDKSNIDLQGSMSFSNQPSLSVASSHTFDVYRSPSNDGTLPCLSLRSYEGINMSSTTKSRPAEDVSDTSDTACSLSIGVTSETANSSSYRMDSKDSFNWEPQYIEDILSSGGLLLEEFALGQAHKIIDPDIFDQLENKKLNFYIAMEEGLLQRKVLFDCVCECLEVRCGKLLAGSCKLWASQVTLLQRRQSLADDLYREILSWRNVEELMVDEVVDKDMSCKNGKWTDFDIEAFEEGIEIEDRIVNSIVDELIDDFLF